MAAKRIGASRRSNTLRTATTALLLLILHLVVVCLVLGYFLAWFGLMAATLAAGSDSESDGVGPVSSSIGVLMWMVIYSVAFAASAGPTVIVLARAIRRTRAGGNTHPSGAVRLERTEAPQLWGMVAELDARLGTRMSTQIWLTPHANAAVAVWPPRGRPHSKTVYLGVPLLEGVDRGELRAILCHELAHCAGRHHSFGVLAHRGSRILRDAGHGLHRAMAITTDVSVFNRLLRWNTRMLIRLFSGYTTLYNRITRHARHQQEYEADRIAAQHVGPEMMGRALVRASETAEAWEAPRRPVSEKRHQGRMTLHEIAQSLSNTPPTDTDQPTRDRGDEGTPSHPTRAQRLAALGMDPTPDLEPPGVPSLQLLAPTDSGTNAKRPKLPHPVTHGLAPSPQVRDAPQPVRLKKPVIALAACMLLIACVSNVVENATNPEEPGSTPHSIPVKPPPDYDDQPPAHFDDNLPARPYQPPLPNYVPPPKVDRIEPP